MKQNFRETNWQSQTKSCFLIHALDLNFWIKANPLHQLHWKDWLLSHKLWHPTIGLGLTQGCKNSKSQLAHPSLKKLSSTTWSPSWIYIYIYRSKEKIDDAKGYVLNPMIDIFYMKNNVRNGESQEASSRPPTSKEQIGELEMGF